MTVLNKSNTFIVDDTHFNSCNTALLIYFSNFISGHFFVYWHAFKIRIKKFLRDYIQVNALIKPEENTGFYSHTHTNVVPIKFYDTKHAHLNLWGMEIKSSLNVQITGKLSFPSSKCNWHVSYFKKILCALFVHKDYSKS